MKSFSGTDVLQAVEHSVDAGEQKKYINAAIESAKKALLSDQKEDGHWCYELEADATSPAEYILMMHFVDEVDEELEKKIAVCAAIKMMRVGGRSTSKEKPM